jgi:hypothetical protein
MSTIDKYYLGHNLIYDDFFKNSIYSYRYFKCIKCNTKIIIHNNNYKSLIDGYYVESYLTCNEIIIKNIIE